MTHFYLGIDVSKSKLDCALRLPNGKLRSKAIPNSTEGFATLLAWLASKPANPRPAWRPRAFIGRQ